MHHRRLASSHLKLRLIGVAAIVVSGTLGGPASPASSSPPVHMFLDAVTCASTSNCIAAGTYALGATGPVLPGVAQWNGAKWTTTAVPVPSDPPSSPTPSHSHGNLFGVTCATTTSCFAVGSYTINNRVRTLIDHWDGKHWALAARPRPAGATSSELHAVSCASPSSCYAVGTATVTGSGLQTLAVRWNGGQWSVTSTPARNHARVNQLDGVSCPTATNCFAVGTYIRGQPVRPLIEHWDGASWSLVASPTTAIGVLRGVSCVSTTNCYAAGTPHTPGEVFIERWNGTSWSIAKTAPPAQVESLIDLYAVSCSGPNQCFATGDYEDSYGGRQLFERWDGAHWKPSPVVGPGTRGMHAVACRSTTFCVAVIGSLVYRWNGAQWTADPTAP